MIRMHTSSTIPFDRAPCTCSQLRTSIQRAGFRIVSFGLVERATAHHLTNVRIVRSGLPSLLTIEPRVRCTFPYEA